MLYHQPLWDQRDVATNIEKISIELSGSVLADSVLQNYIQVVKGDPLIGVDVSDQFNVQFALRNGELQLDTIELLPNTGGELDPNSQYNVTVKSGLTPITGFAIGSDYTFSFSTSAAGAAAAPNITSICALILAVFLMNS